ncbi:MAG: hypothetical protein ACYC63_16585 [Armatimonadota bacterium]
MRFLPLLALLTTAAFAAPTDLIPAPMEIDGGQTWSRDVTIPSHPADHAPVLFVRARIPAGGGGNFVMRVLINGAPLRQSWFSPRLLNKPPTFDPPGTDFHFQWYRDTSWGNFSYSWFTVFGKDPKANWAGTGQDYDYLFDLSGLVSGDKFKLGIEHVFPGLAAALKTDRAPLLVDKITIDTLPQAEIARLKQSILGTLHAAQGTVDPTPPTGEPGPQAYELSWSQRPAPPSQVSFTNLNNWTVQSLGDSKITLSSSHEQRLWQPTVGKLSISKSTNPVSIALLPKTPIKLGGPFDGANFFVYGHKHFMQPDAVTINVQALLNDAKGAEIVVDLGPIRMGYWMLLSGNLSTAELKRHPFPMTFKALLLDSPAAKADYTLYLDSVSFYQRNRQPIFHGRPEKTVFPVSNRGMLPTPPPGVKVTADAFRSSGPLSPAPFPSQGGGTVLRAPTAARFTATSPRGKLIYEVNPALGALTGVTARWNDGAPFRPCLDGGLTAVEGAAPVEATLLSSRFANKGTFTATWQSPDNQKFQCSYFLHGFTLKVDLTAPGGWATGTDFGSIAGLSAPRPIEIPYLKFTPYGTMSHVVAGSGVFVSVFPDIYRSDYSNVKSDLAKVESDRVRLLHQTVYTPLTNGKRNDLRDRLLITASPEFIDTLPNHQNPRSPNIERLAPYMFVMDRAFSLNRWDTFKRYGLDHIIANDFAGLYVDSYSEGFGARWRPHPKYTMEQVQDARKQIKDLGFLFGAYTDVTDFYPLNEFWNENLISLTTTGDLAEAWPGSYMAKTGNLWWLARQVGQKVKQYYPPDCVYLDVSTNRGPSAMDYEAGVPGAGMARAMIVGTGDSLVEARKWYGSTVSEGIYRWMYAGLSDMDYAQVRMTEPIPVPLDFDLLKLHPYQIGTMMGYGPTNLLTAEEVTQLGTSREQPAPKSFYKHVATSLAYGHMTMLGYGYFPPMQRSIQYYALMQGLQREYLPDQVTKIEYYDGQQFLPTSQALQAAAHQRGQVRVTYKNGLLMTVNLNPTDPLTISQAGGTYTLPPYGWVASRGGTGILPVSGPSPALLAFSAIIDGQRLDYVSCPDYTYLNTGDKSRRVGPLQVTGAAWLKREGKSFLLIPCGKLGHWGPDQRLTQIPADRGCPELILDTAALGLKQFSISAIGEMGETQTASTEVLADGRLKIAVTDKSRAYKISSR